MKKTILLILILLLSTATEVAAADLSFSTPAGVSITKSWDRDLTSQNALLSLIDQIGVNCGICVVLGDGSYELGLDLSRNAK